MKLLRKLAALCRALELKELSEFDLYLTHCTVRFNPATLEMKCSVWQEDLHGNDYDNKAWVPSERELGNFIRILEDRYLARVEEKEKAEERERKLAPIYGGAK